MTAVATRDIEPGEEITISCEPFPLMVSSELHSTHNLTDLPLGMPSKHRLRNLDNWGFNCTCSLCTASPEVREASDQRREKLADVYFAMKKSDITHQELIDMTGRFLELIYTERLETRFGEYFQILIMFYYNFRDLDNALKYAKLSLKYSEAFADPDGGFCESLREDIVFLEDLIKKRDGG